MTTENTNENESYQAPSLADSELSDEELNAVAGGQTVFTPQTTKKNIFTPQTTKKNKFKL